MANTTRMVLFLLVIVALAHAVPASKKKHRESRKTKSEDPDTVASTTDKAVAKTTLSGSSDESTESGLEKGAQFLKEAIKKSLGKKGLVSILMKIIKIVGGHLVRRAPGITESEGPEMIPRQFPFSGDYGHVYMESPMAAPDYFHQSKPSGKFRSKFGPGQAIADFIGGRPHLMY